MPNPLIRKLEFGAQLADDDRAAISRAVSETRHIGPKIDLVE